MRSSESPFWGRWRCRCTSSLPNIHYFLAISASRVPCSSVITASRVDRFASLRYRYLSNQHRIGKNRETTLSIKEQTSLTRPDTKPSDLTRRRTCKPTLGLVARKQITYTYFPMSAQEKDYFARVKGPETIRPVTPSAGTGKARTEVFKANLRAYKPTGSKMVSNSVNKTALHPGGVE